MCADTTTRVMRRTQKSVTHVPSLHPVIFLSLDGRGLTSLPRTAIRGEGESRRPRLNRPPNKHQRSRRGVPRGRPGVGGNRKPQPAGPTIPTIPVGSSLVGALGLGTTANPPAGPTIPTIPVGASLVDALGRAPSSPSDGRGLTSLPRTAIRGEGEPKNRYFVFLAVAGI